MKKLLFILIAFVTISLSACTADYTSINGKIENRETLSSKEISDVINYVDESLNNWPNSPQEEEKFLEKYPYTIDFALYLANAEAEGELKGDNKKKAKELQERFKKILAGIN